jgi:hypothetical protein
MTVETTFADRLRQAALHRAAEQDALRNAVARIVLGGRPNRYRLGHIVEVQPDAQFADAYRQAAAAGTLDELTTLGSYAVEVVERVDRNTERSMWATACKGVSDPWRWFNVDQALLHLIAVRHGDADNHGTAVIYGSRMLGFSDYPESGHV